MRILRGRADSPTADRDITRSLVRWTDITGRPGLRVWTPPPMVAFGRRDTGREGYDVARQRAETRSLPAVERDVGGTAVAFTGNTIAIAWTRPTGTGRSGIGSRYEATTAAVSRALESFGIDVVRGEPPRSFCPGSHSLQATGKLAGFAQRVRRNVTLTAGIIVVQDHEALGAILGPIYEALSVPFDPGTVGSVMRAGGPGEPTCVARRLESALVPGPTENWSPIADGDPRVERVRET